MGSICGARSRDYLGNSGTLKESRKRLPEAGGVDGFYGFFQFSHMLIKLRRVRTK